ncbi:unnamed protein product [Blepharisma stoltei]|uniref:RRM domain-containing protein n=1 Tax=Blepharisma stoltei TaxID=1481888 RepID=A0AAU9JC19_9CILI|nr:unnamed protein product [Blepharisma stoltei]
MEGTKSSRWADWSDEDCSNDEENPTVTDQNPEPPTNEQSQEVTEQKSKLESQSPPYTLKLTNVPYKVRHENEIKTFFGLTNEQMDQVKVKMVIEDNRFIGQVFVKIDQKQLALKLLEKDRADFNGRNIRVYASNPHISYINDRVNSKRDYENQRKGRYNEEKNQYNGNERRQYGQENRNYRTDTKKKYIKKESPVIKTSQKITIAPDPENKPHPQKIIIASDSQTNVKTPAKNEERKYPEETTYNLKSIEKPVEVKPTIVSDEKPKPKSNPFASAKPIDTTKRDLIFEEKAKAEKSKVLEDETYHIGKISSKKNEEECVPEKVVEVEHDQEIKNSSEQGNNREDYYQRRPYRGRNFNSRGSTRGGYDGRYRRKEYID